MTATQKDSSSKDGSDYAGGRDAGTSATGVGKRRSTAGDRLRGMLDKRVQAADNLIETQAVLDDKKHELRNVERQYAKTYQQAIDAGWTRAELRAAGLKQPQRTQTNTKKKTKPAEASSGASA